MRTPLGIAVGQASGKLYVASLNTSNVVVYGTGEGGGDTGGGGSATLTFEAGGGSCSVGGTSPTGAPPYGPAVLLLLPVLWLAFRRRDAGTGRSGRDRRGRTPGILFACLLSAGLAAAAHAGPPLAPAGPLASTSGAVLYPHIDSREHKPCEECVITSYSIHYTKLYDALSNPNTPS